ncbi:MAG: Mov34/MPN/PAD-1 family protein [Armatimonadetes bacterium]|nr:Mov34/MPN/PAD-1 family protein [Armatimonadota bacterium]
MSDHDELDANVHLEQPESAETADGTAASGPVVFILETALSAVNTHAAEEKQHEIGGILVGTVTDGDRPVVLIEAAIHGNAMAHTRGSVTFTHETWNEINAVKDNQYPDLKIVGWYHSHPGFGLFLSGHDLFIHRNFFTAPWQVAVVSDPVAETWGCFTWHGQELIQDQSVHTVAVQWSEEAPAAAGPPPPNSAPAQAPIIISSPAPAARDQGLTWALGIIGLLVALVVGLTLATYSDVLVLKGQVASLNQQLSGMAHQLTTVRDAVTPGPEAATPPPAVPSPTSPAPQPPEATAAPPPAPPNGGQ